MLNLALIETNISQLSDVLGHQLLKKQKRIALAESCTGGGLAAAITQISGSSQWFEYGIVSYANVAKIKLLNVSAQVLDTEGAVSESVVLQMLAGVLQLSGADCAISVSGVAGPSGGTPDKPVGTVWLAIGDLKNPKTIKKKFDGDRREVQLQTIEFALRSAIQYIENI